MVNSALTAGPSTAALIPSSSAQTKRLSTNHPSASPSKPVPNGTASTGVKDVVSPGELCGFVCYVQVLLDRGGPIEVMIADELCSG